VDRLIELTVENVPAHTEVKVGQATTAPSTIAK